MGNAEIFVNGAIDVLRGVCDAADGRIGYRGQAVDCIVSELGMLAAVFRYRGQVVVPVIIISLCRRIL